MKKLVNELIGNWGKGSKLAFMVSILLASSLIMSGMLTVAIWAIIGWEVNSNSLILGCIIFAPFFLGSKPAVETAAHFSAYLAGTREG